MTSARFAKVQRPIRRVSMLLLAGLTTWPAARAGAQEWRMDALAGRYRYENSPVGGTSGSALLGLRYLRGASGLSALAGVPLTSADAPWGDLAGVLRLTAAAHPLEWGLHLSGQAFAQGAHGDTTVASMPILPAAARDIPLNRRGVLGGGVEPILGGWGASGEITPLVAYDTPSWSIEGRGGIAGFHSSFADQSFDRLLRVAYLRVSHVLSTNLVLSAEERTQWAQEATYPYLGATAFLTSGSIEAWASLGTWFASGVKTAPWALGARIHVRDRLSVTGSVRRDAFDALFETPARTSWSFGVSVALARPSAIAAPIPQRYSDGVATIGLSASDAEGSVLIAGDFNDWKPQPMKMNHGYWTAQIALPPGVYYYAFVDGDGSWFVPQSVAGRKPDGFGGYVAVLVVG